MPTLRVTEEVAGGRAAFTLVELMVSMAVLSMLVLLLAGAFQAASSAWSRGEAGTERRLTARALMDSLSTELQAALLPVEGKAASGQPDLQFVINPGGGLVPEQSGDIIFWQAPVATESSYGDVAEVGYFVKWDVSAAQAPIPQLCRFFVNPSRSDSRGGVAANPDFLIYQGAWLTAPLLAKVAPADKSHGYAGLFAEGVVGFWAHAYGLDGTELPRSYDSRTGYANHLRMGGQQWTEQRYLPARIRLSLAQIDPQHLSRLAPGWSQVRALTQGSSIREAADFETALRTAAEGSPAVRGLLPWLRLYSTEVFLENAR